jgi:archaellum component FlaC
MLEEIFVSNEENKEKVVDDSTAFFDDIVNNLNMLKEFSILMEERISKIEELVEKMVGPLEDLKKIMLD